MKPSPKKCDGVCLLELNRELVLPPSKGLWDLSDMIWSFKALYDRRRIWHWWGFWFFSGSHIPLKVNYDNENIWTSKIRSYIYFNTVQWLLWPPSGWCCVDKPLTQVCPDLFLVLGLSVPVSQLYIRLGEGGKETGSQASWPAYSRHVIILRRVHIIHKSMKDRPLLSIQTMTSRYQQYLYLAAGLPPGQETAWVMMFQCLIVLNQCFTVAAGWRGAEEKQTKQT